MAEPEDDRRARLAQALRDNLKRRKAQTRARATPPSSEARREHDAATPDLTPKPPRSDDPTEA